MITHSSHSAALIGTPIRALRWPHWERLVQRWLRRWGFALAGWSLGLVGIGFTQSGAIDAHTLARQEVVRLQQQVAALSAALPARRPIPNAPTAPTATETQNLLVRLPGASRPVPVWADLQQVLSANGLRLLSLRPVSPPPVPLLLPLSAKPVAAEKVIAGRLSSLAVELRLQGRFEDWSRTWAAMTEAGPLCAIEQISVAATGQTDEVQIDVVLRLWMRPGQQEGAWAGLATALPRAAGRPSTGFAGPSGGALFAQNQVLAEPVQRAGVDEGDPPNGSDASVAGAKSVAVTDVLSEDPQQWPLARIRLLGLWQQGTEQQAILSAGPHWAKVSPGQRVTLEGHRVTSITDQGLSLRLAQGPVIEILWAAKTAKVKK